jgi:asparagine synthase (glutamine-hydrolysing)
MCGFAGFLSWAPEVNGACREALPEMSRVLRHRGPDAAGIHWSGPCGLAHQRLSIIDLSDAGRQPMPNEDGTIWIAYNGETYNFRELRARFGLDQKGHRFRSRTDTEVIIHLYEEIGIDCFRQLNGMYAFALWDNRSGTLHLARDPFGVKPLFYMLTGSGIWFASEIKALLSVPGYDPRPSTEALHHFLGFDYLPGSLTAFENIRELRPGHRLEINSSSREPQITRFYDIEYCIDHAMSEADAIHTSREILERAVERQLIADVPVGVMLSGGMDSSALTALMAKVRDNSHFHTFSIAFEDSSFDESSYGHMVAEKVGTEHHTILVTADKVRELLPHYLCYIDEPYADGSAIPTYLLAATAKDFVTVLLSGEGGDEIFAGYDTHAAYKVRGWYRHIPQPIRKGIRRGVELLPVSHKKLSLDFKAKRFVRGAELDAPRSHYYWRAVLSEDAKRQLVSESLLNSAFPPSEQFFVETFNSCKASDELSRLLYLDYSFHLPDDLMIKNDRMTMAHSLEARVPFTDQELVGFMATVPVKYKVKGLRTKHLLRSSLNGYLPKAVLKKKKVGLEMPYSRWLRGELHDFAESVLSPMKLKATGLFNGEGVRRLWDEHQAMKVDHGRALWGLINYMLWYDVYIEERNFRSFLSAPREPRTGMRVWG